MNISIEEIKTIVREAGALFGNRKAAEHTRQKGIADYVTEVDVTVQQFVSDKLGALYPEVQFMSEEKDNAQVDKNGMFWVLDPVDGTTNLIHDYQASAVSLALVSGGEPVMGIVYNPFTNEMFWAEKGKGSYLNGRVIHVSKARTMDQSLIAIGTAPYHKELADKNFAMFKHIFMDAQDIRRSGSAAIDLAYVASGRIEGYFERQLKLWDFAAGMLLVREAGGCVLDFSGASAGVENVSDIVAGTLEITQILVEQYLV